MELHQLRYFVTVARLGNFTRAAEACAVAQPSLSQQIKKLEDEMGERLFHRIPGGKSVLTPAGELLHARACRILEEVENATSELRARHELISGEVRVGAIPTIAPFLLADAVMAFGQDYPEVGLVAHEATTAQLLQSLEQGELDMAVLSPPLDGGPWSMRSLGVEPLFLVAREDAPILKQKNPKLSQLRQQEFILMREGHCLTAQVSEFCDRARFRPKVRFQSAQVETLRSFIRAGVGVSLLPAMSLSRYANTEPTLKFKRLCKPEPTREIVIAWRPDAGLSRACLVFQEQLDASFAGLERKL